jgi:hypothetical protein
MRRTACLPSRTRCWQAVAENELGCALEDRLTAGMFIKVDGEPPVFLGVCVGDAARAAGTSDAAVADGVDGGLRPGSMV